MSERPHHYLDAGFWRAVWVMAFISVVLMAVVVLYPIDRWFLPEASTVSVPIDNIFKFSMFFGVPILVYVNGFLIYFTLRYRRRPGDPSGAVGSQIHDHRALETWWTIIPGVLMVALAIISYFVIPQYYPTGQAAASAVTMEAIGHKFSFEFRYPGLRDSVYGELHLPVGVPVTVDVTSSEESQDTATEAVLHGFWVPEFRIKQDMIPGMVVPIHFTPREVGTFRIVCSEFCGLGHSKMWGKVIVQSRPDFDRWYAAQKHAEGAAGIEGLSLAGGDASAGQSLFAAKCSVCHNAAPFDQRKVGPGLGNLFHDPQHPDLVTGSAATPKNVAEIIEHGAHGDMGVMPDMHANGLTAKDVANLIAYLQSLHK
ncbi:MAG: cytochrome c oxidase subunit II [Candidatus Eremiobacteraeota bacterium]|nr:cytochrome c oxidase subunit II [Candidatus Eremiobacteraeota bacterium]